MPGQGGYTRGDTHTHMRSTTHHVRSNTPGNNLSFFTFSGVSCIRNSASYERDGPMSPVTTVFSSPPSHCRCPTARALFLPASHPRYGRQGPRERSRAPSGEFPLCSAPYLLTTHHHHFLPHHRFKRDKNRPTMPRQMQPPPPNQPPLAIATLGL